MINPFHFTDRMLQIGLNSTLESHLISHANSKLIIIPSNPEFGFELRHFNKIIKALSAIYAGIIKQEDSNNKHFSQQDLINKMRTIMY